jgi:hypothetical protein
MRECVHASQGAVFILHVPQLFPAQMPGNGLGTVDQLTVRIHYLQVL